MINCLPLNEFYLYADDFFNFKNISEIFQTIFDVVVKAFQDLADWFSQCDETNEPNLLEDQKNNGLDSISIRPIENNKIQASVVMETLENTLSFNCWLINEIILNLFQRFSISQLCSLSSVCQKWNTLILNNSVWKNHFDNECGLKIFKQSELTKPTFSYKEQIKINRENKYPSLALTEDEITFITKTNNYMVCGINDKLFEEALKKFIQNSPPEFKEAHSEWFKDNGAKFFEAREHYSLTFDSTISINTFLMSAFLEILPQMPPRNWMDRIISPKILESYTKLRFNQNANKLEENGRLIPDDLKDVNWTTLPTQFCQQLAGKMYEKDVSFIDININAIPDDMDLYFGLSEEAEYLRDVCSGILIKVPLSDGVYRYSLADSNLSDYFLSIL